MDMRKVDRGLLIVALLAALANYEGLSLATGVSTLWQHAFCAAMALGVFTCISLFWYTVFNVLPHLEDRRLRIGGWVTTGLGAILILGISAFWSVASLGGPAALQSLYEGVIAQAEQTLAETKASSGQFQKQLPGLEALDTDLGTMAKCEGKGGCLTSGGGPGGVSALLGQLRDRADAILTAAHESKTRLDGMAGKATACLGAMRQALSVAASVQAKEDELSRQVDCFNGALADLGNVAGGEGVAQSLDGFTSGIVVPASVKSDKQKAVTEKLLAGLKQRTAELAQVARAAIPAVHFAPVQMVRVNATVAVIQAPGTVIPAWATAICLDLAPLALLLLIALKAAANRTKPDESHLDRPIKDLLSARRALAELDKIANINIDTTTPAGIFVYTMLSALAEFERRTLSQRTKEGLQAARRRGKQIGRPPVLTDRQVCDARHSVEIVGKSTSSVAKEMGVPRWTLSRAIRRASDGLAVPLQTGR